MRKRIAWLALIFGSTSFGAAQASVGYTFTLSIDSCSGSGDGAFCASFDSVAKQLVLTIPELQSRHLGGALGYSESITTDQASVQSAFSTALLAQSRTGAALDKASFSLDLTSPIGSVSTSPYQSFTFSKDKTAYFDLPSGPMLESYGMTISSISNVDLDPVTFDSGSMGRILENLPTYNFSAYFVTRLVSATPLERESWVSVFGTATYGLAPLPAVPEPESWILLLGGLGLMGGIAWRRRPAGAEARPPRCVAGMSV